MKHKFIQYAADDEARNGRLGTHEWTFVPGVDPIRFDVADVVGDCPNLEIANAAMVHGFKQKIADAAAIPFDKTARRYATDAEKRAAMAEIVERLNAGSWNADRTGPTKLVDVDVLVATIAGILRKPVIGVRAFIESKDEPGRRALADSAQFAETYILGVAAKRPRTDVDTSELDAIPDA